MISEVAYSYFNVGNFNINTPWHPTSALHATKSRMSAFMLVLLEKLRWNDAWRRRRILTKAENKEKKMCEPSVTWVDSSFKTESDVGRQISVLRMC